MPRLTVVLAVLVLAGCVAPSQATLNQASAACSDGDRVACSQVGALNAQVQQENQSAQVGIGVAAVAGGLLGGAALGGAFDGPHYYQHGYRRGCCW